MPNLADGLAPMGAKAQLYTTVVDALLTALAGGIGRNCQTLPYHADLGCSNRGCSNICHRCPL
jgi:hypothetical protein